jgi:type II secretory pathway component PulC
MPGPEQTPEDKLLEIIENPPKQMAAAASESSAGGVKGGAGFPMLPSIFNMGAWRGRADLRHANRVVLVLCVVLSVLCGLYFKNTMTGLNKKFEAISVPGNVPEPAVSDKVSRSINLQQTITLAKEHNIFTLYHDRTSVEGLLVGDGQETANLKLVGVLWSENNPQAMVEDTVEQKTHLLAVGDQVAHLTVKAITKDKVILAREDRVWELR